MSLVIAAEVVPLKLDADGVARISGTRVTLESLLAAYCQGATAEEIAQRYSAVSLSDVYAVITYYLRHRADVEDYLAQSQARSEQTRQEYAPQLDPHRIRERLLARRSGQ